MSLLHATAALLTTLVAGQSSIFFVCENGATFGNRARLDASLFVEGNLDMGRDSSVNDGAIVVTGNALFRNRFMQDGDFDIDVGGTATIGRDVNLDEGDMRVGGDLASGNRYSLHMDGSMDVGGGCRLGDDTEINDDLTCMEGLRAGNRFFVAGDLEAGMVTLGLDNTLGSVKALNDVTFEGRTTVNGNVKAGGAIDIGFESHVGGKIKAYLKKINIYVEPPRLEALLGCSKATFKRGNNVEINQSDGETALDDRVYGSVTLNKLSKILIPSGITSFRRLAVTGTSVTIYMFPDSVLYVEAIDGDIFNDFTIEQITHPHRP